MPLLQAHSPITSPFLNPCSVYEIPVKFLRKNSYIQILSKFRYYRPTSGPTPQRLDIVVDVCRVGAARELEIIRLQLVAQIDYSRVHRVVGTVCWSGGRSARRRRRRRGGVVSNGSRLRRVDRQVRKSQNVILIRHLDGDKFSLNRSRRVHRHRIDLDELIRINQNCRTVVRMNHNCRINHN
jgi:hypothetical protein